MYGQANATAYFSGNSVVVQNRSMAQRKGVLTLRVVLILGATLLLGSLMASRIFLTNQITGLRANVAELESRKEFLEAGSARLFTHWNRVSNGDLIVQRAERELGLVVPENPGLVLVCSKMAESQNGAWYKLKSRLPGKDLARIKAGAEEMVTGAMVSLTPRGVRAGTPPFGGK